MKSLKFSLKRKMSSPILTFFFPLSSVYCLVRMGSSTLGSWSSTFSISSGLPSYTASSTIFWNISELSLTTQMLFSCSMFLSHLQACTYGSMISGYAMAFCTIIALLVLMVSEDRPFCCHSRMSSSLPSMLCRLKLYECGMLSSWQSEIHLLVSLSLKLPEKGP